jgi:hypothetical protein
MKKITLLSFLFMTAAFISNAQINNGNFEIWTTATGGTYTYDTLVNWKTTDLNSQQNGDGHPHSAGPTTDAYQGDTALLLTSWSAGSGFFPGIPGAASNGDVFVNITTLTVKPIGGVPDNVRHGQLAGYYKYEPAGSDIGSIEACLFKWNSTTSTRDTVAYGAFNPLANQSSYIQFSMNLISMSTNDPDSSLIWIQSSPRSPLGSGKTGTKLYVDTIYYQGLIGVEEISPLVKSMMTYPVPASTELNVKMDLTQHVSMNYNIVDVKGKIVLSGQMENETQKVDVRNLAAGHYVVNVNDLSGKKLSSHNFTIAR